ncbi:hypothetical protein CR164_08365 [Prosthecochloris marina]|uniref:Uncharacterized protein n=1 Tax=Prosthecochloris marina TaxID=2017681 RepID=A0A317T5A9_9CHLB|nr:hypothetical protein CR164_08365 [Prosthecochloris marina]
MLPKLFISLGDITRLLFWVLKKIRVVNPCPFLSHSEGAPFPRQQLHGQPYLEQLRFHRDETKKANRYKTSL